MRHLLILLLAVTLLALLAKPLAVAADTGDHPLPNGYFYTETAGANMPAGSGYAITDEGADERGQTIKFWSEFQRLGGISVLGYPASRRFIWSGFICQVTQRGVLQWRPDANAAYLMNIMDLITTAGKDDYLEAARQIPLPEDFRLAEQNLSFQQIVDRRYALLDANPAIKAKFFSVADPLTFNGLPVAAVRDMGDVFVLRAQRIVIQQWKKDMPWAKAGEVTVALGGDIAKETGLVAAQDSLAVQPVMPAGSSGTAATSGSLAQTVATIETLQSYEGTLSATIKTAAKDQQIEISYHIAGQARYALGTIITEAGKQQRLNVIRIGEQYWIQSPDVSERWFPVSPSHQEDVARIVRGVMIGSLFTTGTMALLNHITASIAPNKIGIESVGDSTTTHWQLVAKENNATILIDYWIENSMNYPAKIDMSFTSGTDVVTFHLSLTNVNGQVDVHAP